MKKYIFSFVLSLLMFSCGSDDGGDPTPTPAENKAPSVPVQTAPVNNLLCIDNTVVFEWNASTDPEGDSVTYELQIAKDNSFSAIVETRTTTDTNATVSLEKGVAYYWRVKSRDVKNASSDYSSVYSFYTEGEGERNHLPFLPELVAPSLNALVQTSTIELKWDASDVDENDTLLFDVYLGVENPPTERVAKDINEKTFTASLSSGNSYYWKVVVKDDKGGNSIGAVWSFKTD